MRAIRVIKFGVFGLAVCLVAGPVVFGQIVINELVDDERTAGSGQVTPDTREFVELFNPTANAVNIGDWTLKTVQLGSNFGLPAGVTTYTIPTGASIAAGGYYVIGAATVPLVNFTPPFPAGRDMLPDGVTAPAAAASNGNYVLELRNTATTLVDAVALETFRGTELANVTEEQLAQVGGGWWAQNLSMNANAPNLRQSLARFLDGRDNNVNGRDFGILPITPGASNNLPQNQSHTIPDVDALAIETPLSANYYSAFVLPRVVDPTVADGIVNPKALPMRSPQGGNAIMAYDESGGGDASYSKELVNSFELYAYIDTAPLNLANATTTLFSEASTYGIGSTDQFFGTPNQAGLLTLTSTQNGNTGYGWMIQRVENFAAGSATTTTLLQFIDFNDGGDSLPGDNDWKIIKTIDLTGQDSAWHRLGVDYDPITGEVEGRFDNQTFVPTLEGDYNDNGVVDAADYVVWRDTGGTQEDYDIWRANFGAIGVAPTPGLVGTFYVGYRDNLGAAFATSRPPTFDMIGTPAALGAGSVPEPSSVALLMLALLGFAARRFRG